jgi:RNA polymerase sigma-70 factor (ECF subfamily)
MYLTAACLGNVPGAVDTFAQRHGPTIRAVVTRLLGGADARDVEQRLFDKLVVGTAEVRPRLVTYVGRAPLDRWLGVTARREAISWLRENRAVAQAHADAAAEPGPNIEIHPELAFLRDRYREEFERALKDALTRVTERERIILRMHLVNGLSIEKVGKMLGVSQSTVSRWLASARETLHGDIKTNLGNRLGVTSAQLASLARLVASHLELGLSQALETG